MPVGLSENTANAILDSIGQYVYIQLHMGDPGYDGTSNIAAISVRVQAELDTAYNGSRTLYDWVEWMDDPWVGQPQTVTHVSAWTADSGGDFLFSAVLAAPADFIPGYRVRLTALSISIPSIASD